MVCSVDGRYGNTTQDAGGVPASGEGNASVVHNRGECAGEDNGNPLSIRAPADIRDPDVRY